VTRVSDKLTSAESSVTRFSDVLGISKFPQNLDVAPECEQTGDPGIGKGTLTETLEYFEGVCEINREGLGSSISTEMTTELAGN
jgi:hypothetical protein